MELSKDQVLRLARLARLRLTDEEVERFSGQLTSILAYVDVLKELDTDSVLPTSQVTGLVNGNREDFVRPNELALPDELLACSALPKDDHQIRVRRVL